MTDSSSGKRPASAAQNRKKNARRTDALASSEGVLANLPRTRPQRSSARRENARRSTPQAVAAPAVAKAETKARSVSLAEAGTGTAAKAKTRARAKAKPAAKAVTETKAAAKRKRAPTKPVQDLAPRQGFEAESDPIGSSVRPPGGLDVFASAAELAGELTKNGLSHGGRVLKDLLTRLPLS